mgnify:CR=1 FL=1
MDELKYVSLATAYEIDNTFDSERFIKMRLKVMHDGANPNGSRFNVRDIQNAESSIYNSPILAHTIVDEENQSVDVGAHDMHWERNKVKDGEYKLIYDELIVGVVPETNNYELLECDGKQYVFVDCYIYKEYCNYLEEYLEQNPDTPLSMEIYVDKSEYNKNDNVYDILEFRYKGITFLGKQYGTGMIGAKAQVYSLENKEGLFSLLSDLKTDIEKYQSSLQGVDINTFLKKEDDLTLNEKLELLKQYNIEAETLDFSLDEISLEDLKVKLEDNKNNFALVGQFMDELIEKLSAEKIESEWGSYAKYSFVDYDPDVGEVYCWDRADWKLYGFTYSVSGDSIEVDFACKKRKKFSIVDFIDGTEDNMNFELHFKDIVDAVSESDKAKFGNLQSEFDTYKSDYSTPNVEVEELKVFKANTLAEKRNADETELFAQFDEKLNSDTEYETLKASCKEMSLDEISDKCFSILGKKLANFALNKPKSNSIKLPIAHTDDGDTKPYGDVYEKYLK